MKPEPSAALQQHQQDVFRRIRLPVIGAALLPLGVAILLMIGWATGNMSAQQVTCVAAGMSVIFLFIPLVLLMLIINFLSLLLSFSAPKLTDFLKPPLERVRQYSETGAKLTQTGSEKITEPIINLRVKVAYWRAMTLGIDEVKADETKQQN